MTREEERYIGVIRPGRAMDSGNLRGRFHLVVEVPELVRYHMDMAGSLEVKVVEDRHVHRCRGKGPFQQISSGHGSYYAGDLDDFFRHCRFNLGNTVFGFLDLLFIEERNKFESPKSK